MSYSDANVIPRQSNREVIRVGKAIRTNRTFLTFCFLKFCVNPDAEENLYFVKMVKYISF